MSLPLSGGTITGSLTVLGGIIDPYSPAPEFMPLRSIVEGSTCLFCPAGGATSSATLTDDGIIRYITIPTAGGDEDQAGVYFPNVNGNPNSACFLLRAGGIYEVSVELSMVSNSGTPTLAVPCSVKWQFSGTPLPLSFPLATPYDFISGGLDGGLYKCGGSSSFLIRPAVDTYAFPVVQQNALASPAGVTLNPTSIFIGISRLG